VFKAKGDAKRGPLLLAPGERPTTGRGWGCYALRYRSEALWGAGGVERAGLGWGAGGTGGKDERCAHAL